MRSCLPPFCLIIAAALWTVKPAATTENAESVVLLSANSFNSWDAKEFKGKTDYWPTTVNGEWALKAETGGQASGLVKKQTIDLTKTPYLNWRWRIDKPLGPRAEQTKAGDDFSARVYVVLSGGIAFWRTQAVNYVWAGASAKNSFWPNPFAGEHAMMLALRNLSDPTGVWINEKRHIVKDFKKLTGQSVDHIDAVAIMTDADNGGGSAVAYYGDIVFSAD